MGRKARVTFRARRSFARFQDNLKSEHPFLAWQILSELRLPPAKARFVILQTVCAAQNFVKAQNKQAADVVAAEAQLKIAKASKQVSNSVKRAPSGVRRRLNQEIFSIIQVAIVDLEVVESIFDATTALFKETLADKPSAAPLPSLRRLRIDFSTLGMRLQLKIQDAIAEIALTSGAKDQDATFDVFAKIAAVIRDEGITKTSFQMSAGLITRYVTAVAAIWQQAGLRPSRVTKSLDPADKSKFHRFAELVLTEMLEPWAGRHRRDLETRRQQIQRAHAALPIEIRPWVSSALKRADCEWLISDECVKRVIAQFKFPTAKHHMTKPLRRSKR